VKRLLRALFVDNAPLKAVSMALALTLFTLVHAERDTQAGFNVPVVYELSPDRVLTSDPPGVVHLVVRGPWTKLRQFDESQLAPLEIDLARVAEGDLHLEPDMVKLPPGLTAVEFSPPTLRIAFQARETRSLPILTTLDGVPAHGYHVESTQVTPAAVDVVGPKEAVDALSQLATAPLSVAGRSEDFKAAIGLAMLPPHVTLVDGAPAVTAVTVAVAITPELAERDIAGVSVQVTNLKHLEATVNPPIVLLQVHGEELRTEQVTPASLTAEIDGAGLEALGPGDHLVSPTVAGLPPGVAVVIEPPTVTVTLR